MKGGTRLKHLADLAGVSVATVSRALNNSSAVNDETKRRIWQLARDHNYAFRPHMPALLSGATATLAIVIPTPTGRSSKVNDPFYLELIGGVGEAAREMGCDVLISHVAPKNYEDLHQLVSASRAEGVIFLGQSFLHERFNRLADAGERFTVWGAQLPGQKYCSVGSDNIAGGRKATSHLIRLGRKRIAFFGDREAPEVAQRYQGYAEALTEAGIGVDPDLVSQAHFELESAEASVHAMLSRGIRFDGVFAASDLIALGAIRAARRAGLNVPQDVSVVGYDNIQIARYHTPAITTISQDMGKAGRLLVSKLLSDAQASQLLSERLPTELIVRESCGS